MGRPPPEKIDLDPDDPDHELLAKVVEFYRAAFEAEPEAKEWLGKSGFTHPDLPSAFTIGLANRTLGPALPSKHTVRGRRVRDRLEQLGVFRADTGHEHLRGGIVVPLFNNDGEIVQLYGHLIGTGLRTGITRDLWLPSPKVGLVNSAAFETKEVVITATVLDALTLWSMGIASVTAVPGLHGPFADLIAAVEAKGVTRITFAFPRGEEADAAIRTIRNGIATQGVEFFRASLPKSTFAFDLAQALPDPAATITALVRSAEWIGGSPKKPIKEPDTKEPDLAMGDGRRDPQKSDTQKSEQPDADTKDGELIFNFGDRRWRIRGLNDNKARGSMKVNVLVSREVVGGFHVDTFDVYSARHRSAFVRLGGEELGVEEAVLKKDLGHVLLALEHGQEELLRKLERPDTKPVEMSLKEREDALGLLRDPKLLDRLGADFEKLGVVGERDNLLVAFLVSISRKLDKPLAAIVQSSPAAGKSSLMDAVLKLVPEEDRHSFSAMTGQALFYMGPKKLRHRVISIAEEQGASKAAYSLKLLQSEGSLSIASTGKDQTTGQLVSHEYKVEGPVALMMTTTAIDVDEELLSRCLVLTVDEGSEPTRRIQERQRWATTLEGRLRGRDEARLVRVHQNAQRLLRPVLVANPFALDIVFPDRRVRARRDHPKLLGLVETIALLHQHQRPLKRAEHEGVVVEYIEVEPADVEAATRLLEGLGLGDATELPPQTRKLLDGLLEVRNGAADRQSYRFTRREVRERLALGSTQAKIHLRRLVDAEYVIVHRSPHGRGVIYELAYDDDRSALEGERSGEGRAKAGGRSAGGRPSEIATNTRGEKPIGSMWAEIAENARRGDQPPERHSDGTAAR